MGTKENPSLVGALADLDAKVFAMRKLGVTKWGDIELGPLPNEPDHSEQEAPQKEYKIEEHPLLFAASGG